ncbi:hypothetical protein B0T24DRAFT_642459 [Lasiosphaeria ovina]|uniref:Uncharacterized protein n=1 Tax=Lasiosphaeria ovina TaxID=92902 RepID=A0AAE0JU37_9PEZI|nr:hypothetical protein B0T24DRAFT_642459 [Lasiosphaeria ovina]
MALTSYEESPVTLVESLQIPDTPYMYAPDLGDEKRTDQDGRQYGLPIAAESYLNERWKDFVIPGPISSFAYADRVKIIQDLLDALAALDSELQTIESAEKQHWKTWDENQKELAEWNVRLSRNHFIGLKRKWARFRYAFSSRRGYAYDIHWTSLAMKRHPLLVRKRNLFEGARQQLQELNEREAVVMKMRENRTRLEKLWDPDFLRGEELVGRMYGRELTKMRSVMWESRRQKEAVEIS